MFWSGCVLISLLVLTSCSELHDKVISSLMRMCPRQYVATDKNTGLNQTSEFASCCTDAFSNSSLASPVFDKPEYAAGGQRCLFPSSDVRLQTVQNERSYLMITEPPKSGCLWPDNDNEMNGGKKRIQPTCNDSDLIPFKRFLPVYSQSSGFIYKNQQCASCHGQNDVNIWETYAFCKSSTAFSLDTEECNFQLIYSGDYDDIQHLECFTEYYSACPELTSAYSVNILEENDMSIKELSDACSMDNIPRFAHIYFAKNIFCYICHYCQTSCRLPTTACRRSSMLKSSKSTGSSGFMRILDSRVVGQMFSGQDLVCGLDTDRQVCHEVLCPLGQILTFDGLEKKCQMDSTRWTASKFVIILLLEFDHGIDVYKNDLETIFRREKLPWPEAWSMGILYQPFRRNVDMVSIGRNTYNVTKALMVDSVDHAYVQLSYGQNDVNPAALLNNLEKLLHMDKVYLTMDGMRISARQTLSKSTFQKLNTILSPGDAPKLSIPLWQLSPDVAPYKRWLYKDYVVKQKLKYGYSLNKLLLCKQIELTSTDVHVTTYADTPTTLYFNRTGLRLFDNEFTKGSGRHGEQTFRICLANTRLQSNEGITFQFSLALLLFAMALLSVK